MYTEKKRGGLRAGLFLLAACLTGSFVLQAAERPSQSGDRSGASANHSKIEKLAHSKDRKSKAANAKRKAQTEAKAPSSKQEAADSAKEITQLKQQLAIQQKQIAELLHAVNQLQAEVTAAPKPAAAAAVAQVSGSTSAASAAQPASNATHTPSAYGQPSSNDEIASLTPILLPESKARSADANLVLALNTPVSLPQAKESTGAGLGPAAAARPAVTGTKSLPVAGQPETEKTFVDSPLQFRIGRAYVTPVGFMDFTSIWANHDAGSGIGTNFAGIPYGNVFQNHLSEFRFSAQNSRVGFRVDAIVKGAHVMGYMESDFLGFSPGNAAVSSNSNSLRSRLYWVDVRKNKWEVLGGQTWSLITPGRTGISPLPGDLFYSQDTDVNYQLGLFWARNPELRFVYHLSSRIAFAVALDSPEQYVGGSAGGGLITFPAALKSTYEDELNIGTNTFSVPNVAPDVIAKLALDPSSKLHFEIGGVERNFKLWNPNTNITYSTAGGGGFANLNFELFKGFRVLTNNFWSDGGGRYIFGQAPDLIVRADGSPSLIHASSTVSGFEYTRENTMFYGYYGGLYIGRNVAIDTNGNPIGYGYTGAPNSQNRVIQEATFGFNRTLWKNASWGALNLLGQYSYVTRNPWYVVTGQPRNASLNMVFVDLHYTLPGSAPAIK